MSNLELSRPMVSSRLLTIRSISIFTLVCVYLLWVFFPVALVKNLFNIVLIITIVECLPFLSGLIRYLSYLLLAIGIVILLSIKAGGSIWVTALWKNMSIVTLIVLVPLLALPLKFGGYLEEVEKFWLKSLRTVTKSYVLTMYFSFALASALNLAAIPFVYQICTTGKTTELRVLLSRALVRGFSMAAMWTPAFSAMALVLNCVDVEWGNIFLVGLFLAVSALALSMIFFPLRRIYRGDNRLSLEDINLAEIKVNYWKIIELIIVFILMIFLVFFLEGMGNIEIITAIPLISLTFPVIWAIYLKKWRQFCQEVVLFFYERLPEMKNEVMIFIAAGFFGHAVAISPLKSILAEFFYRFAGSGPVEVSILSFIIVFGFASLGVHPVVTVTTIGTVIDPKLLGMSPEFLALVLLSSYSLGVISSPLAVSNITVAGFLGTSSLEVGPKWNFVYAVILGVYMLLVLNLMRVFFGL